MIKLTLTILSCTLIQLTYAQQRMDWPAWFVDIQKSIETGDLGLFIKATPIDKEHREVIKSELGMADSIPTKGSVDSLVQAEVELLQKENRYRFIALQEELNYNGKLLPEFSRDSMSYTDTRTPGKTAIRDYVFYLSTDTWRVEIGMTTLRLGKHEKIFQWNTTAYVPEKDMPTLCECFERITKTRERIYESSNEELVKAEAELEKHQAQCKGYMIRYPQDKLEEMLESCGQEI